MTIYHHYHPMTQHKCTLFVQIFLSETFSRQSLLKVGDSRPAQYDTCIWISWVKHIWYLEDVKLFQTLAWYLHESFCKEFEIVWIFFCEFNAAVDLWTLAEKRISPLNQWGLSQVVAEFWLTSAVNHVMENLPETYQKTYQMFLAGKAYQMFSCRLEGCWTMIIYFTYHQDRIMIYIYILCFGHPKQHHVATREPSRCNRFCCSFCRAWNHVPVSGHREWFTTFPFSILQYSSYCSNIIDHSMVACWFSSRWLSLF